MEEILRLLKDNDGDLNEAEQIIKKKIDDIVELKAKEMATEMLDEEKAVLLEKYEKKFEDYKNELVEHLSNFIDKIIDEMEIPDYIVEWARKGELYDDVIETLKTRMAIDEGLIKKEVKTLLHEAKDALAEKDAKINKLISENLEKEADLRTLAAELYVRSKTDGLNESTKLKALNLLAGITDKEEIDRKLDIIINTMNDAQVNEEENVNAAGKGQAMVNESKENNQEPWHNFLDSLLK